MGVAVSPCVGVGVIVAKMIGVGVGTDCCLFDPGNALITNPIAILNIMIRLSM
jgi:hypothetical protein